LNTDVVRAVDTFCFFTLRSVAPRYNDGKYPMVAGREATPKDAASTERLMRYWSEGAGAAKIG
jgi:hypothetical protein